MLDNDLATIAVVIKDEYLAYEPSVAPSKGKDFLPLLHAAEFCKSFGHKVTPRMLLHLMLIGNGPPCRVWNGLLFFEREDLEAWLPHGMVMLSRYSPSKLALAAAEMGMLQADEILKLAKLRGDTVTPVLLRKIMSACGYPPEREAE